MHKSFAQRLIPPKRIQIIRGLGFSGAVALVGVRRRALAPSGAAAATALGTVIYTAGGMPWSSVLLAFFGTSSALSRRPADIHATERDVTARGSRRDYIQAIANGGIAGCVALAYLARKHEALTVAYAGALAAANADTWATEIGSRSKQPPRSITTGRVVAAGTSGGVTLRGTAAALAGSSMVAVAAGASIASLRSPTACLSVCAGGFVGALADSVVGATVQAGYQCPTCREYTERRTHRCGSATTRVRGQTWCTNDVVNLLCTAVGALSAVGICRAWSQRGIADRRLPFSL